MFFLFGEKTVPLKHAQKINGLLFSILILLVVLDSCTPSAKYLFKKLHFSTKSTEDSPFLLLALIWL